MNMKTFYEMTLLLKENLDVESKFTPSILASMNRKLKSMGYDVRGSQDVKNILKKGSVYRDGAFIVPDWETAYQSAIGTAQKTQETLKRKKELTPNVNRANLNQLGTTTNPKQAGYIHPKGTLVDLSGGDPYGRGYDHRVVGGYAAIQELGAHEGYIRYMPEAGGLELRKMPTPAQLTQISKLIAYHNGEINLDLYDGIGEWNPRHDQYDSSIRSYSNMFPEGTKPMRIINAIKQFYAGETPAGSIRDRF